MPYRIYINNYDQYEFDFKNKDEVIQFLLDNQRFGWTYKTIKTSELHK